jgi:hypothetical protein
MPRPLHALALAAVLAAVGCDELEDRLKTCRDVPCDLVNTRQTGVTVNLAGPEEGLGAETAVAPGASRQISLCIERGDRKAFRAGRDGQVIATATCVVQQNQDNYEGRTLRVVYDPASGLRCEGW